MIPSTIRDGDGGGGTQRLKCVIVELEYEYNAYIIINSCNLTLPLSHPDGATQYDHEFWTLTFVCEDQFLPVPSASPC